MYGRDGEPFGPQGGDGVVLARAAPGNPLLVKVIQGCPTVRVELESRPDSVALVRAMLTGAVELLEFDSSLLDDLSTAVSEACNNVVLHAYPGAPGPLTVQLEAREAGVEVSIRDRGTGFQQATASEDGMGGSGMALITALADRAEFFSAPGGGTEVRVAFTRGVAGEMLPCRATEGDCPERLPRDRGCEVLVTLSPMALLPGILGRMTRLLAARARFSLERFSDTYLLIDRVVAHAESHAVSPGISFGLCARESRLELKIGPLQRETFSVAAPPSDPARSADPAPSQIEPLVDELAVKPIAHSQMLYMVVRDYERV